MIGAALALAASLAHATARYDCTMDVPKSVAPDGSTRQINFPGVPADMWHFTASIDSDAAGVPSDVTVTWNGDPIQIAGKHLTVVTADGSVAFAAASAGPCMFTEAMCLTLVNMARQLGLVVGISIMVGLLGSGVPALARFQHVWVFMAASSAAAAIAALVMDAMRRSADKSAKAAQSCTPTAKMGGSRPIVRTLKP